MAAAAVASDELPAPIPRPPENPAALATYLGLSFAVFLALLPKAAAAHLCALQSRNRCLSLQLRHAEDQIRQIRSRRKEDSKANARVVEIFASHRNAWQQEERRLLARIDELEACERDLRERLETKAAEEEAKEEETEAEAEAEAEGAWVGSSSDGWQDLQYQAPLEPLYPVNHFTPRRDSPWKGGSETTGIPVKLKQAEQELHNLEKAGKVELPAMRKQVKRYQSLTLKIDDLCKRMQVNDHPTEISLNPDFRTQAQTGFLQEACSLQQRATEARQKLTASQVEMTSSSSSISDELSAQAKLDARKSLDSLRISFKEIQRNLEVWLARIVGDIEGILARERMSREKDFYFSRYPFVR